MAEFALGFSGGVSYRPVVHGFNVFADDARRHVAEMIIDAG